MRVLRREGIYDTPSHPAQYGVSGGLDARLGNNINDLAG